MKAALFLVSLVSFIQIWAKEVPDTIPPPYSVSAPESDASLDANHAVFELYFKPSRFESNEDNELITIELSCNGVIERFTRIENGMPAKELMVSPGKYRFQVIRNGNYDEIITDSIEISGQNRRAITFHFPLAYREVYLKPVIYTYASEPKNTTIQVVPNGAFTFTYPSVQNNQWTGTAHPDGSFTTNGKNYPYLFWEGDGKNALSASYDNGFIVESGEAIAFLEEKLALMGMNDKEMTDFITFWGPKMAQSGRGFAHFLFNDEYDNVARMKVTPTPDNLFRVYLIWTPLETTVDLKVIPQKIPDIQRDGFYLIEWGGSVLPTITSISMR